MIGVLKEHEAGAKVDDISRGTPSTRRASNLLHLAEEVQKYGGMEANDAKRLREIEAGSAPPLITQFQPDGFSSVPP